MCQEMMGFGDAVASAGPPANNLYSRQTVNPTNTSLKFLQAECSSWRTTNSVRALKAQNDL